MTTRFVLNELGIQEIGLSEGIGLAVEKQALEAATATKNLAPYDELNTTRPHYRDLITVDVGESEGVIIARVNADKFTSVWLEFGTVKMRAFAPLRRGAEAAGLTVRGGKETGHYTRGSPGK